MARRSGPTNRNGLIGAHAEFAPLKRTMSEIVSLIAERKRNPDAPVERVSTEVARIEGFSLVRYRLGSEEVQRDFAAGGNPPHSTSDHADIRAIFGVLDGEGHPQLLLDIIEDGDGPQISFAIPIPGTTLPADVALQVLDRIDVPASWRCGADATLADRYDARWAADGGWERQEPRHLVKVEFERICFATRPAMREAVDVFMLPHPGQDIADPDPDKAYWAKDFYRHAAWDEFARLPQSEGARAGFSSWMSSGEPAIVKVLNTSLDREIARLEQDAPSDETPAASPRG